MSEHVQNKLHTRQLIRVEYKADGQYIGGPGAWIYEPANNNVRVFQLCINKPHDKNGQSHQNRLPRLCCGSLQ
jgi:hypothetical protein